MEISTKFLSRDILLWFVIYLPCFVFVYVWRSYRRNSLQTAAQKLISWTLGADNNCAAVDKISTDIDPQRICVTAELVNIA